MAKLTAKDWEQIEVRYKAGDKLRDIADDYNYDSGNIAKKAKKLGWVHGELQQPINEKVNAIKNMVDVDVKLQQNLQRSQLDAVNNIVERELNIKQYAEDTQFKILDVMRKASIAADKFIKDNPSGTYVKRQDEKGITYGLTTEVISHLAPVLSGATAIIKDDKPTTAIQINNENKTEEKVIINIEGI